MQVWNFFKLKSNANGEITFMEGIGFITETGENQSRLCFLNHYHKFVTILEL
jgi:hypothetical protein